MKVITFAVLLLFGPMLWRDAAVAEAASRQTIVLASTTSVENSGLLANILSTRTVAISDLPSSFTGTLRQIQLSLYAIVFLLFLYWPRSGKCGIGKTELSSDARPINGVSEQRSGTSGPRTPRALSKFSL